MSQDLRNYLRATIPRRPFKAPPPLLKLTGDADLDARIAEKQKVYGLDAYDALRSLAMVPVDLANTPMMDVKLRAAIALMPKQAAEMINPGTPSDTLLAALKESFAANQPRIAQIRERIVSFQNGTETKEVAVINPPIEAGSDQP